MPIIEEQERENIVEEARRMRVDKNIVKRCVRKAAVVGIAAVMGMSLFACTKPETRYKLNRQRRQ